MFCSGELILTVLKTFPSNIFAKNTLKRVSSLKYSYANLMHISILEFWFKIHNPDKISNLLMGHTVSFHENVRFSYFWLVHHCLSDTLGVPRRYSGFFLWICMVHGNTKQDLGRKKYFKERFCRNFHFC